MRALILGIDGYIGYALAQHLLKRGHEVYGIDDYYRRAIVAQVGSQSLTPIDTSYARYVQLAKNYTNFRGYSEFSIGVDHTELRSIFRNFLPEVIVHLAEQPSAPFSMKGPEICKDTQIRNVTSTLDVLWMMKEFAPDAHLLKLGTMGEYGTPNCNIPEGKIPVDGCMAPSVDGKWREVECPMGGLLFPRSPGSFYHASKVMDTINIEMACRLWGLRSTDIMQGVVFGLSPKDGFTDLTRFDYDECFGTVINRFCVQALISHPLTIYGKGEQTRGYLPLKDSLQCLTLALENPPQPGEYRTFNQFAQTFSINQLAAMVTEAANRIGINPLSKTYDNPRIELEEHYYQPSHQGLFDLGYQPTEDIVGEIEKLLTQLRQYADRVITHVINPHTKWR